MAGCAGTDRPAPIREYQAAAPSKPAPALPAAPFGYYRIVPGDTLYKIAFEQGRDVQDLAEWNRLADPGQIRSGQLLRVLPPPTVSAPVVTRAVPSGPSIASRPLPPATAPPAAAPRQAIAPPATPAPAPAPAQKPLIPLDDEADPDTWSWPMKGNLLARFGDGLSKGIDIAGNRGTPVFAAASGQVVYAGSGLRGYGKLIIIRHGKNLLSAYAHNDHILVKEGESVKRGQTVAQVGDSDADRIKLHFEIRERGKPVDPLNYLPNAG